MLALDISLASINLIVCFLSVVCSYTNVISYIFLKGNISLYNNILY